MKNILECEKGKELRIIKVHTTGSLKQRLLSFGIMRGAIITLMAFSPTKSTVELMVGKTTLALRSDEAKAIEVEVIE
ncbi:MAG: ferrous iron transport protein A [Helicobacteraceae bacterium]|nr:ferrous iron transport protein A [Helicobacteraceae bacterium]